MNTSIVNPYVRLAVPSVIPRGHNISPRIIYDYEIIYLESGSFTLTYDGRSYTCSAGDVIFIRPGVEHSFLIDCTDISQPHIHFDMTHRPQSEIIPISFKRFDAMTETERSWIHKDYFLSCKGSPIITVQNRSAFLDIFFKVVYGECDPLTEKSLMIQIISVIVKDNFPAALEKKEQSTAERRIKDYIDAGNGLAMSLDEFSKNFNYNKFYLDKRFKGAFGVSLIEYRNKKRMEYAKQLLKKHSVSKVAQQLGYRSIYSFSRAYKSYYGIAPSKHADS